jgi:hypothetical protein
VSTLFLFTMVPKKKKKEREYCSVRLPKGSLGQVRKLSIHREPRVLTHCKPELRYILTKYKIDASSENHF